MRYYFIFTLFLLFLLETPFLLAEGPAGNGELPPEDVVAVNVPEGNKAVLSDDASVDVSVTAVEAVTHNIRLFFDRNGTNYTVFDVDVDFSTGSPDFSAVVAEMNPDTKTVVAHTDPDSGDFAGDKVIYIPRKSGDNRIGICSAATALADVFNGCASVSGITENQYDVNGDTGTHTVGTFTDANNELYWRVTSVSGSGGYSFKVDLGGAVPSVTSAGSTINLDEEEHVEYLSRKNLEHFLYVDGTSYSVEVMDVDINEAYAVIYFSDFEKTLAVKNGAVEELDFDNDGTYDILLRVTAIDYPDVYISFTTPLAAGEALLPTVDETAYADRTGFQDGGGIWTTFLHLQKEAKVKILYWMIFTIFLLFFISLIGGGVVNKVWKGV